MLFLERRSQLLARGVALRLPLALVPDDELGDVAKVAGAFAVGPHGSLDSELRLFDTLWFHGCRCDRR